jgi:hypothetical protein
VAAALRRLPGLDVEVIDGNRGEFTVLVDGRAVAHKGQEMPSVEEVVSAVQQAAPAKQSV